MKKIITSMLDDDLYKFSMQNAILELFPDAMAKYRFINRGEQRFNEQLKNALIDQLENTFPFLKITDEELVWFSNRCSYLKTWYFEYLKNYRYNPKQVKVSMSNDQNLVIDIEGKWHETVLWEVKLMAIISELYFKIIDKNWTMDRQDTRASQKAKLLTANQCNFTDFGTRRRRSHETQDIIIRAMKEFGGFMGTSNVFFAMKHNIRAIGSFAHEWVQGNAILESLQHADYYAMNNWNRVFNSQLGIALTDTYGFDSFLKNFNIKFAKLFDGIRNDSGDEFSFVDKSIEHYKKLNINPLHKFIIFSNALDCNRCIALKKYCNGRINCSFGIGTRLTNHFDNSPPLNMVIKLSEINGMPAVKLSDDKGKTMGDSDAVKVMQWIYNNKEK